MAVYDDGHETIAIKDHTIAGDITLRALAGTDSLLVKSVRITRDTVGRVRLHHGLDSANNLIWSGNLEPRVQGGESGIDFDVPDGATLRISADGSGKIDGVIRVRRR